MTVSKRILTTGMLVLAAAFAAGCSQSEPGVEAPPGANVQVIQPAVHNPNKPKLKMGTSAPGGGGGPASPAGN